MSTSDSDPGKIDTGEFLRFLFSTLFLFVTCLHLTLYIPNTVAIVVNLLLRSIVLPKNTLLRFGSIGISPLRARIFFRDLYFQDENASMRIVDGYFTFSFTGYWFQSPSWTTVREHMVKDSLIGTRCRARVNFKFTKGTIVGVEAEKKRIIVELDPNAADSQSDEDDGPREGEGGLGDTVEAPTVMRGVEMDEADAVTQDSAPSEEPSWANGARGGAFSASTSATGGRRGGAGGGDPFMTRVPVKERTVPLSCTDTAGLSGPTGQTATGDEVVKTFEPADVRIRSRPGMCQLHLNGTRLCVYNATGRYKDLLNGAPYTEGPAADAGKEGHRSKEELEQEAGRESKKTVHRLFKALRGKLRERDLDVAEDAADSYRAAGVEAAKKVQRHQLANKTFMQRFFNFIGAMEVELFATTIDIGGVKAPHPYFLHLTTLRTEGRIFITRDGCCPLDLYRMAFDFTMQQVDMRMAKMDNALSNTFMENLLMRNTTLRDRARLMFNGTTNRLSSTDAAFAASTTEASSDLIRNFGILLDGKDKSNVHVLFYRDTPNVYAGEEIHRDALPRTGCEIVLDTPNFCYGPWMEYCRGNMWQYFMPPNYRPLQPLEFVVGKPRPNAGFEFFVEFMRETRFEVPFKRRAVAPSPPFGIKDSHEKGMLVATIGAGSQYIQKGVFLLPGEEKQNYEALFMGKNITAWSNCVLGRMALLCHFDSLQFFLDRQDDKMWNGRKLWNILPKISGAEVFFFMPLVDFFLDLLNDWQFAENMYHNVPLTTEVYNTYERAVRDFVPNVKRFEVFMDGFATIYINSNAQNVVYAHDPCDLSKNTFSILKVQQASFSMVLPSDQYQLSSRNEMARPFEVSGKEVKAYVSLPPSHPLFSEVSAEIPFAHSEQMQVLGTYIVNVANQSLPQDKNPIIPETGRTKLHNYLDLEIEFTNMHGTLMGPHITGLVNFFENTFLDNTMTIAPDELFWLLAKLQSHVTTGKNKRRELKQYLESKAPVGNDLEVCVLVRLTDVEASLVTSQVKGAPGVLLSTAQFTFSYVKQFACGDMAITMTPLVARLCDSHGRIPRHGTENFIATGDIRVGIVSHYGRMPLKPKIHESIDAHVDGISFQVDVEQLVVLMDVLRTLEGQLKAQDVLWVAAVEEARAVAEYAAEQLWRGPRLRPGEQDTPWWLDPRQEAPTAMFDFYFRNNQICRDARAAKSRGAAGRKDGARVGDIAGNRTERAEPHTHSSQGRTVLTGGAGPRARTPFDGLQFQSSDGFYETEQSGEGNYDVSGVGSSDADGAIGGGKERAAAQGRHGRGRGAGVGGSSGTGRRAARDPASTTRATESAAFVFYGSPPRRGGADGFYSDEGSVAEMPMVLPLHATESAEARPRRGRGGSTLPQLSAVSGPRGGGGGGGGDSLSGSSRAGEDDDGDDGDAASNDFADGVDPEPSLVFANSIPRDVARGFAYFMEEMHKAEDDAKDYGIVFTHVVVGRVVGSLRIQDGGYLSLELPNGLALAQSTLNDGNSSQRMSVAVRDVSVRGLLARRKAFAGYTIPPAEALDLGEYVEVFHLQTSLCVRRFVAYPFDGSLERHRERQRQFIEANDYEGLVRYAFFPNEDPPTTAATATEPAAAARGAPPPPPPSEPPPPPSLPPTTPRQGPREVLPVVPSTSTRRPSASTPVEPPTLPRPQRRAGSLSTPTHDGVPPTITHVHESAAGGLHEVAAPLFSLAAGRLGHTGPSGASGGGAPRRGVDSNRSGPQEQTALPVHVQQPWPRPDEERVPSAQGHGLATVTSAAAAAAGGGGGASAAAPRVEAGGLHDSADEDASALSQDSGETTAHTGDVARRGGGEHRRTLDSHGATQRSDLLTSGARFATCLSGSDFSHLETASGSLGSMLDDTMPAPELLNKAFAADRVDEDAPPGVEAPRSDRTRRRSAGSEGSYWLQQPIPLYHFSRTFDKDEVGEGVGGSPTLLSFRVPRRPTRSRPIRNRTYFSAPLPATGFTASDAACFVPEFVMSTALEKERVAEGDLTGAASDASPRRMSFAWATHTADNRERSKAGSTTKHVHVETVAPVTVLVTLQAAELAAAAVEAYTVHSADLEEAAARRQLRDGSTMVLSQVSTVPGGGRRSRRPKVATFAKQAAQRKSRTRERQKRWLSEDTILSALVACVELKLLTALPVPAENLPDPREPVEGMYCSTFTVRDVAFHSWRNHPPAGVEVGMDATRRLSASLKVAAMSLVTQIEYEPILREGGLHVHVPGVLYDMEKDTIAVLYLAQVRGSGKQDRVRGSEGGACHVSVHRVSAHLTRDFLDYALSLRLVGQELLDRIAAGRQARAEALVDGYASSPMGSPTAFTAAQAAARARQGATRLSAGRPAGSSGGRTSTAATAASRPTARASPLSLIGGSVGGGTVQGKGCVGTIEVVIVDTRKEGRLIRVNLNRATSLDITSPSASFVLTTPHRSRDRHVQLQCVGEMTRVRAMLFPALLHTLRAQGRSRRGASPSPPSSMAACPGAGPAPLSVPAPGQTMTAASAKWARGVTFSEVRAKAVSGERAATQARAETGLDAAPSASTPTHAQTQTHTHSTTPTSNRNAPTSADGAGKPTRTGGGGGKAKSKGKGKSSASGRTSPMPRSPAAGPATSYPDPSSPGSPMSSAPTYRAKDASGSAGPAESDVLQSPHPPTPAPAPASESLSLVYNCSFTLRSLDVSLLHSELNYVQLRGQSLMGCADNRGEHVSSRECIQMEVLTEVISEPMRERLRQHARRARERAAQSRYAAPASTSEQLQLRAGACFFMRSLRLNYVADPLIPQSKGGRAQPRAGEGGREGAQRQRQRMLDTQVAVALVEDVAISAHLTDQYDIVGEQTNVAVQVKKVLVDMPFRTNAEEVIHPQIRLFLSAWRRALKYLTKPVTTTQLSSAGMRMRGAGVASPIAAVPLQAPAALVASPGMVHPGLTFLSAAAAPASDRAAGEGSGGGAALPTGADGAARRRTANWNSAFLITAQVESMEAVVGLPQNIRQRLLLPKMSVFLQGSSDKRLSAKVHLHPFTITSKLTDDEPDGPGNYAVTLPNIYILYAHDAIKMTASLMVETVAITVTPLFINHMLLTYEKVSADVLTIFSNVEVEAGEEGATGDSGSLPSSAASPMSLRTPESGSPSASFPARRRASGGVDVPPSRGAGKDRRHTSTSVKPTRRRQSILFLLQGMRVSYLTSVTNLRFTVRRISATADSVSQMARNTLRWVVHVSSAQVALVDRHDHDQMLAAVDSAMRQSRATHVEEGGAGEGASSSVSPSTRVLSRQQGRRPTLTGSTAMAGAGGYSSVVGGVGPGRDGRGGFGRSKSSNSSSTGEAHRLRAVHPVSGYIWGSAELSLTLSSGTMDTTKGKTALQENASFSAYSSDLQKALLDTLGHTSSQWELSIYSPLVIVRFGLVNLLRMCFDETRDDIERMKAAAHQESARFRRELTRHRTFRKLQREKKRYDALVKHTEKERLARLRRMTAQVASDVSRRRGGLALDDNETRMVLDYFNITREHRFVATIAHFLAVVPFGDAAFRSLLEDTPDTYACGRAHRHIHTASCMNRRNFIPTLALKLRVEETSLVFSLESVKRFVPVLKQAGIGLTGGVDMDSEDSSSSRNSDSLAHALRKSFQRARHATPTVESDYVSSFKFCGRFLVTNTSLYFTEGSPVDERTTLADLIADTGVLGGHGTLSEYSKHELRQSRNTIYVACIECPVHIDRKGVATKVGAIFDLTGPRVQLSSRIVNIASELAMEVPPEELCHDFHQLHRRRRATSTDDGSALVKSPKLVEGLGTAPAPPVSPQTPRHSLRGRGVPGEGGGMDSPDESPRTRVDVSARLAAGLVRIYAFSNPSAVGGGRDEGLAGGPHGAQAMEGKFARRAGTASAARRRVAFGVAASDAQPPSSSSLPRSGSAAPVRGGLSQILSRGPSPSPMAGSEGEQAEASAHFARSEEFMESLLTVPLPGVLAQLITDRGGTVLDEDYTCARVEVRAGTVELSPSITSLAREIEACAKVYDYHQQERRLATLARVQALEKEVAGLTVPLHSTLEDVLLPMPAALCNVLASLRMRSAIDLRRSSRSMDTAEASTEASHALAQAAGKTRRAALKAPAAAVAPSTAKPVSKSFTGIHIALTSLRVILTTEPIASTAFTVYLEEHSSIDLLVKVFKRPEPTTRFLNRFPDISLMLCARNLRAECQTKLEVKSLEISLPEAELVFSQRSGGVGTVSTVTASFPLSAQGSDPNVILRAQHLSQLMMVIQLWTTTLTDTLRSVQRLAVRGAPVDVVAQRVRETPIGQRVRSGATALTHATLGKNERLIVGASVSRGLVRVDLGSGNMHQLFIGEAHLALESAKHALGNNALLLIGSLSNFSVRSEGVLAGVVSVSSVLLQGFVIRNKSGSVDFVRSRDGRTFRQSLAVQGVNVTFKERQLRDIFECTVGSFTGSSMDGIGEEGYTTTDLDVTLSRATLGVTPSTVPAVLSFVRTVSAMVSEQHRVALHRLGTWAKSAQAGQDSLSTTPRSGVAVGDVHAPPLSPLTVPPPAPPPPPPPAVRSEYRSETQAQATPPLLAVARKGEARRRRSSSTPAMIPFMGNHLVRVPCGQLRFTLEETTLMLGSTSSSSDATAASSVVVSFPRARLLFAECPCDDYSAVKKALILESHNVELYRPGTPRIVIIGFKGVNLFDFYTRQVLGESTVGFTLALRQTHPWTGNPRFRDFEEMIMLIRSFTDKQNASVFRRFGQMEGEESAGGVAGGLDAGAPASTASSPPRVVFFSEARTPVRTGAGMEMPTGVVVGVAPSPTRAAADSASAHHVDPAVGRARTPEAGPLLESSAGLHSDARLLRPLGSTKFSPQLRFGGDVSVNTEVILNWIGITEKMLPTVVNARLCDKLEHMLAALADAASERQIPAKEEVRGREAR